MEGHGERLPTRKHRFTLWAVGAGLLAASTGVCAAPAQFKPTVAADPLPASMAASGTKAEATSSSLPQAYSHIPLQFERNQGQTAKAVQYLARGPGYSLFLTADEAVMNLREGNGGTVLRAGLAGANPHPSITAEEALAGRANYFHGRDPSRWQHDVPEFGRVHLHNVYDGVDLVYYGNQQQLEYDFLVAPGADSDRIHVRYRGLPTAAIDAQGNLHLGSGSHEVIEHKPVAYQLRDGQRVPVAGSFRMKPQADQSIDVAFEVGDHDSSLPLIIDPVLSYATFLGGSGSGGDVGYAVAVDGAGYAYIAGMTRSIDFPTTSGAFQSSAPSSWADAFITKLTPDGSALVFSTYLDGTDWSQANGIALGEYGVIYVVGSTNTRDFPVTPGAFQPYLAGAWNAFVTKLSADGSQLLYSTYLGGSGYDDGNAIAVDIAGDAFVTGNSQSTNFPTTSGAFQTTPGQVFVTKLASDGGSLMYSTYLGGPSIGAGTGIAVDIMGNAYVTGYYGSGFPTTPTAFQRTISSSASYNAFFTQIGPTGSNLNGSTYLGGSHADIARGIALHNGSAYLTGWAGSQDFPTTSGAYQTHPNSGAGNAFVTVVGGFADHLYYSTLLGGSSYNGDQGQSIAVDNNGLAYVTGNTTSSDFPTTAGAYQRALKGVQNAFVSQLNARGSSLLYSTYLGGDAGASGVGGEANGIAYGAGSVVVTGATQAAGFPVTPGAFQGQLAGAQNSFVARLSNIGLSLSPAGLNLGRVAVNSVSAPQTLTLTNGTSSSLTITSVSTQFPVFAQTNTCGTTLAAGASCSFSVTFAPLAAQTVVDSLKVSTSQGVLTAGLNGTGIGAAPIVKLSASSLDFDVVPVNTTSKPKAIRLTNVGKGALAIGQISLDLYSVPSFSQTNNCPAYLASRAYCTITLRFTPDTGGTINGTLNIVSNAASSPNVVTLIGIGDNGGGE